MEETNTTKGQGKMSWEKDKVWRVKTLLGEFLMVCPEYFKKDSASTFCHALKGGVDRVISITESNKRALKNSVQSSINTNLYRCI